MLITCVVDNPATRIAREKISNIQTTLENLSHWSVHLVSFADYILTSLDFKFNFSLHKPSSHRKYVIKTYKVAFEHAECFKRKASKQVIN